VLRSVELAVIRVAQENGPVAAFPDPHSLARDELTSVVQELTSREEVVSDERRVLHAQIDALANSSSTGLATRATWSSLALTFSIPNRPPHAAAQPEPTEPFGRHRPTRGTD